jgi:hypothetical protein
VFWDWVFGTRYTGDVEPERVGIADDPFESQGFVAGLARSTFRSYEALGRVLCKTLGFAWAQPEEGSAAPEAADAAGLGRRKAA